jgi:predicted nuclease with TOPRIM domain
MPTPEERFIALEQFRTETLRAYTDVAYELTIVKGLGEDSIKRLAELRREMNTRFDSMQDDLRTLRAELSELDGRLTTRLDDIVGTLAVLIRKLDEGK